MYHRVADTPHRNDPYGLCMPPDRFEAQMKALKQAGYRCLSLSEVLACYQGQMRPPRRAFAITFDDGYEDNFQTAWPVLRACGFTATIFLVVERLGRMTDWPGQDGPYAAPLMTLEQARQMQAGGITMGSHTLTHASLVDIPPQEARRQIARSRQVLAERLGQPVHFFSYPYDRLNPDIIEMVGDSGYLGACGNSALPPGPFNMWRVECQRTDSMFLFRLKVSGLYHRFLHLRDQTHFGQMARKIKRLLSLQGGQI